jgi:predicted nucleotidyltransferase component of viral defense system
MIRAVSKEKNVLQNIVEKDYALSYLLSAIYSVPELQKNLVLKGGTALKKLYFRDYRFSEDLDFSTRQIGRIETIDDLIRLTVNKMAALLHERGPFRVEYEPYLLRNPHPNDQIAYIIRVQFPDHREPLCRLKVEISVDEPILKLPEIRPLLHGFPEVISAEIPAYLLLEITAEKLRALLQSKEKLQQRGWGATRVCRDYFDLRHLLKIDNINSSELKILLKQKCEIRNVSYGSSEDFITRELLQTARTEWKQQLSPFIPDAPSAEEVLAEVQQLIFTILS